MPFFPLIDWKEETGHLTCQYQYLPCVNKMIVAIQKI